MLFPGKVWNTCFVEPHLSAFTNNFVTNSFVTNKVVSNLALCPDRLIMAE